jgi:serine protease Do
MVRQVLPQLIATGHVSRGRIGVVIQGMDEDLAQALGLDHAHGALVEDVEQGSPADKAGIKSGDVIVAVEGQDVPHSSDLPRMVAMHAPGSQVKVTYLRDKKTHDATLTLAPLQNEGEQARGSEPGNRGNETSQPSSSALGIAVSDDGGQVTIERVSPEGPADGKLRAGDVIEEINHQPVTSASDLSSKLRAAPGDKPVLLRVKHGDQSRFVAIEHH